MWRFLRKCRKTGEKRPMSREISTILAEQLHKRTVSEDPFKKPSGACLAHFTHDTINMISKSKRDAML